MLICAIDNSLHIRDLIHSFCDYYLINALDIRLNAINIMRDKGLNISFLIHSTCKVVLRIQDLILCVMYLTQVWIYLNSALFFCKSLKGSYYFAKITLFCVFGVMQCIL